MKSESEGKLGWITDDLKHVETSDKHETSTLNQENEEKTLQEVFGENITRISKTDNLPSGSLGTVEEKSSGSEKVKNVSKCVC